MAAASVSLAILLLCTTLSQGHLRSRTFYPLGSRSELSMDPAPRANPIGFDVGAFGGNEVNDFNFERKDPRCLFCRVGRGKRSSPA